MTLLHDVRVRVDEAELDDVPLAAQLGKHDVHPQPTCARIARLFGDLDWSDASRELVRVCGA